MHSFYIVLAIGYTVAMSMFAAGYAARAEAKRQPIPVEADTSGNRRS